jgi:DNA-3-methyladenine glycosylase
MTKKLQSKFYTRDALTVARKLLGKTLVRVWDDGSLSRFTITITEAYLGSEDKACHASKGRTSRTEIMYSEGGHIYVYLIYGMYWLLNVVTGETDQPQAVLICGLDEIKGSGRVGRTLMINKSFYAEMLTESERIWIEDSDTNEKYYTEPRVGVHYAGDEWANKPWRFVMERNNSTRRPKANKKRI